MVVSEGSFLAYLYPSNDAGDLMRRAGSFEKTLMLGKIEGRRRRGQQEDEMIGWHHRLNGHEFG